MWLRPHSPPFQGGVAARSINVAKHHWPRRRVVNRRSRSVAQPPYKYPRSAPYFCWNLRTTPSAPLRNGTVLLRRSHPSLKTEGMNSLQQLSSISKLLGSGNHQKSDVYPHYNHSFRNLWDSSDQKPIFNRWSVNLLRTSGVYARD